MTEHEIFLTTFLVLQVVVPFGIYKLVSLGRIETKFEFWLACLSLAISSTLVNVGVLGLILGGPSILVSTGLTAMLLFKNKSQGGGG